MVHRLPSKQTFVFTAFAGRPKFKVVVVGIFDTKDTFGLCDCGKVEMDEDCLIGRAGVGTNEEKATTRVIGNCLDRSHPKSLAKGIFTPC